MAQLLTEEEIEGRLRDAQWMREGETIVRERGSRTSRRRSRS